MASMPQRQPPQHQTTQAASSNEQTSPTASQSPILTRSANSEDSEVVILEHNQQSSADKPSSQISTKPVDSAADEPDSEVKKCWICFSDSSEDTAETSPWRDPCPCALVAHEECLLDWIADMEAPKNSRNRSFALPQITCPQCKSEIKLARPKNYIVDVARGLERLGSRLVWPGALTLLSGLIVQGNFALGIHTVYRIFGAQDGNRILQPVLRSMITPPIDFDLPPRVIAARILYKAIQHTRHWRVYLGVPLITPLLVLSRTSFADSVMPALPVLFLATQAHSSGEVLDFTAWPPSASMAFAVLPYLRSAYNAYFSRVWAKKEQEWMREIEPRASPQDGDGEQQDGNAAQPAAADDDNMFEVRIDGGIWQDLDGGDGDNDLPNVVQAEAEPRPEQGGENVGAQNAEPAAAAAPPPPNVADNRPAQPAAAQAQPQQQNERRLSFSTTAVAETVMGALAFPTIAELSGEILRLVLPLSWTSKAVTNASTVTTSPSWGSPRALSSVGPRGLLQEKWGRSLVGGCLFVVLKDAVMLYVRWRSAKMHRERRVLDYQRKKKAARS